MDITRTQLSGSTREEHDLLGYMQVPEEYYFGIQTMRAIQNFNISRVKLCVFPEIIKALAEVKAAAALANNELGLMDDKTAKAIVDACKLVAEGKYDGHFVVDMVQGGAGTSVNMNANEVIANVALELMGHKKGQYKYCHPNNHINLSQSTNDAYPTAMKVALIRSIGKLQGNLRELVDTFKVKGKEFENVIKMGRTQLQDAVPMTLGQEFDAFADNLAEDIDRLEQNYKLLYEMNMGATAIGTGINSDPDYPAICEKHLRKITGLPMVVASNMIEATSDMGAFVINSAALKRVAIKMSKICNDLRLLSSGPRCGFGEINLPPMQPGSSIMPGKVNPVIPEVVNQVAFKVMGNDMTISIAAEAGQLQLNVMEPIIIHSLMESIDMLANAMDTLRTKCVAGITANEEVCRNMVYNSIGLVTALNPYIGYEASTELAKEAMNTGKGVYELVLEHDLMSKEQLDDILRPENMVKPRKFLKK